MILKILMVLGSLGVFLYGMKVMSEGLQKSAGQRLQSILNFMTANRFFGVMTGFLITSIIQSSSATTVMIVSFANAGLLNLTQSISTIMGSNIGTTVTSWIVSLLGFKVDIAVIAVPVIGIGLPFMFAKKKSRRDLGDFIIGFGILFLGLGLLKSSVPDIQEYPEVLERIQQFHYTGFGSFVLLVLFGTALTAIIQSSSAMMAITVTMAFKGWIDFPTGAALCLGENIGTTITAYLASLGTGVNARRAARAHTLFNVIGVMWMSVAFGAFLDLLPKIAPWNFHEQANYPLSLSLFHTCFNITNTIILLPFVNYFARAVEFLVKPTVRDTVKGFKLPFMRSSLLETPELYLIEAKKALADMGGIAIKMFNSVMEVFHNPDKKMGNLVEEIREMELLSDQYQEELTRYLLECSKEKLNDQSHFTINAMIRIAHELENICDSCFNLCLLTQRKYDKKIVLHEKAESEIRSYSSLILDFLEMCNIHLVRNLPDGELKRAVDFESRINEQRNQLRKRSRNRMNEGSPVKTELLYIDMIKHFEHIGDHAQNVAQALNSIERP